ncbi:hypothetical protein QQ045_003752 [Rhodiola kirilowii]
MGASPSVLEKSIHDFTVKDSKGNDVDLGIYKGKVLLVVNVASRCGLTDANYTQLTKLYSNYKTKAPNKPALEELGASRQCKQIQGYFGMSVFFRSHYTYRQRIFVYWKKRTITLDMQAKEGFNNPTKLENILKSFVSKHELFNV